eukprot:11193358-Lingulodinium_polyedra.AAC.1
MLRLSFTTTSTASRATTGTVVCSTSGRPSRTSRARSRPQMTRISSSSGSCSIAGVSATVSQRRAP